MGYSILMYEILQVSGGGVRQSKLITHPLRNEARALMKPVALPWFWVHPTKVAQLITPVI